MHSRAHQRHALRQHGGFLVTFLIILGVIGLAVMSSRKEWKQGTTREQTNTPKQEKSAVNDQHQSFLLMNEDAATLLFFDGTRERLTFDALKQWLQQIATRENVLRNIQPIEGVDSANGARVFFQLPQEGKREPAVPSPDGMYTARLDVPIADGAGVVRIERGPLATPELLEARNGGATSPRTLVLRTQQGKPYKDATLAGWFDPNTIAVIARATTTRMILALDRAGGTVQRLAALPDALVWIDERGGTVWYVTAALGEGLESPPRGPSELHRVSTDGINRLMARDEHRVFLGVVPGPRDLFAYTLDDGQSFLAMSNTDARQELKKLRPLLFTSDGSLLLRDGFDVVLYDPKTKGQKKLGSLPEGRVEVYEFPLSPVKLK